MGKFARAMGHINLTLNPRLKRTAMCARVCALFENLTFVVLKSMFMTFIRANAQSHNILLLRNAFIQFLTRKRRLHSGLLILPAVIRSPVIAFNFRRTLHFRRTNSYSGCAQTFDNFDLSTGCFRSTVLRR